MKPSIHLLCVFIISLGLSIGSLCWTSTDYVDAAEFGIASSGDSDFRKTKVWGQPVPFVADHLYHPNVGRIDKNDIFRSGYFVVNSIFWFFGVVIVDGVVVAIVWQSKKFLARRS